MNGTKWTSLEDAILMALYPVVDSYDLAQFLGRTLGQVYNRAYKFKLKKALQLVKVDTLSNICNIHNKSKGNRFKKGNKPWNTGIKTKELLSDIAKKGMAKTQFKKGNAPHNTKHDGAISIRHDKARPYKHIRLAKGKWKLLHRHVWEQKHGKIPPKHIITFIDGDTMNCDISNLKMISMKENVKRNGIANYPPEAIKILKIRKQLITKIKKHHGKKQVK